MPSSDEIRSAAVIGAGMAGLRAARGLVDAGFRVRVFEKARGPGGRLPTRRAEAGHFDHGAQYFTARHPLFREQVDDWCARGVAEAWQPRVVKLVAGELANAAPEEQASPRYVGAPRMSAIGRDLAAGLEVELGTRVASVAHDAESWRITLEAADGVAAQAPRDEAFGALVVATPPEQALPFVVHSPSIEQAVRSARVWPCQAVLVAFDEPLELGFDAAFVSASPLGWIARNSSKPGRPEGECWVLHATPEWSEANIEADPAEVAALLSASFGEALGRSLPRPSYQAAHRWRYARVREALPPQAHWDAGPRLGICGDWVGGDRVEDAYLSGARLADAIVAGTR